LLSDISIVAISAWQTLMSMMANTYDQKNYQAALLVLKTISQNIVRKLEKIMKSDVQETR
jgi:hypothetical protein